MKLILVVFLVSPIFVFAEPGIFFQFGQRQINDRALGAYYLKQGPFNESQLVSFYFEHELRGNIFTSLTLIGESIVKDCESGCVPNVRFKISLKKMS